MGKVGIVAIALVTLGVGCSGQVDSTAEESLGSAQEALTTFFAIQGRSDVQVVKFSNTSGWLVCPSSTALGGMDQSDGTKRLVCTTTPITWDAGGINTHDVNLANPQYDQPPSLPTNPLNDGNHQRVLTFLASSPNRWVGIGVNFDTGQIRVRLAAGGGISQFVRSPTSDIEKYVDSFGNLSDIHACPNKSGRVAPLIHGANVLLTYSAPVSQLATWDFSCQP